MNKRKMSGILLLMLMFMMPLQTATAWPWIIDNIRSATVEHICQDGVIVLDVYIFPDVLSGERILQTRSLPADFLSTQLNLPQQTIDNLEQQIEDYGYTEGINYADLVTDDDLTAHPLLATPVQYEVQPRPWPIYDIVGPTAQDEYAYAQQTWQPDLAVGQLIAVEMIPLAGAPLTKFIVAAVPDCELPDPGDIIRISNNTAGDAANGASGQPAITRSGARIAFASGATDIISGITDNNSADDVFVWTATAGEMRLLSIADGARATADGASNSPDIDNLGDYVAFASSAGNLNDQSGCGFADTNGLFDVYGVDPNAIQDGERLSLYRSNGNCLGLRGDALQPNIAGGSVAFSAMGSLTVPSGGDVTDGNGAADVLRAGDPTQTLSVQTSIAGLLTGNGASTNVAQAGATNVDTLVVFETQADDLAANDSNGAISDIVLLDSDSIPVRDAQAALGTIISRASNGEQANGDSNNPAFSTNGLQVAFDSIATNLDAQASDGTRQVYVHDLASGCTTLLSQSAHGVAGDDDSSHPSISMNGRFVAFESMATNLVDGDQNDVADIFVVDRDSDLDGEFYTGVCVPDAHRLWRVSTTADGGDANGHSFEADIASSGAWVAFTSSATDLAGADGNDADDVFVAYLGYPTLPSEVPLRVGLQSTAAGAAASSSLPLYLLLAAISTLLLFKRRTKC